MIKEIINCILEIKICIAALIKLKKIMNNIKVVEIPKEICQSYKIKWKRLKRFPSVRYLRAFTSINGIQSENYVPEDIYYSRIEPVLNRKAFSLAYADKNFYERYLPEYKDYFPKTILRGINGKIYDTSYSLIDDAAIEFKWIENEKEFILKPASETSGGKRVVGVKYEAGNFKIKNESLNKNQFIKYLHDAYQANFVLQERISQHSFFADFNLSSLNTIRLFTYRSIKNDSVYPLQAVLRFGKSGSLVDNQASGGLSVGISAAGRINSYFIDKWGIKVSFPEKTISKTKDVVPGFSEMKEIACKIAKNYLFQRLLGFDLCYSANNKVKLLEINCKNIETNFLQMNNGPLFGDFTDEVIQYCSSNKKTVVLDFEI